jgi:hypothetical protein
MKKFLTLIYICFYFIKVNADEGMWLLPDLQGQIETMMKQMGLKLSANDIYNYDSASIKDAVVIFGQGCTGEIISDKGLILTNHHCGFSNVQSISTLEKNYLENGFWAKSFEEEIPVPDLDITFLLKAENITNLFNNINGDTLSDAEYQKLINKRCSEIEDSFENREKNIFAIVKPMYEGNQYYLFVYQKYNDIRLVGTPPSSIGKFGGDTDNWMWPRHTADFSLFRVYADSLGNPAPYSNANIPLCPKYYLKISLDGYSENDFTFILGYPGSSQRYSSSYEIDEISNIINLNRIKIRNIKLGIIQDEMLKNDKIKLRYASKYAASSNYYKFSIGQNFSIKMYNLLNDKIQTEDSLLNFFRLNDSIRYNELATSLDNIKKTIEDRRKSLYALQFLNECLIRGAEIFNFAYSSKTLLNDYHSSQSKNFSSSNFFNEAIKFYKNFDLNTEKKLAFTLINLLYQNIEAKYLPAFYNTINKKYSGNIQKYVDDIYKKSMFSDSLKLISFLKNFNPSKLEKDPIYVVSLNIFSKFRELYDNYSNASEIFFKARKIYTKYLMSINADFPKYPDANFTMRLTFGKVKSYKPRDAVYYNYKTSYIGLLEKEDSLNWEFKMPEYLKELLVKKDFGKYATNDTLFVCFITDNDITGGNSGSPVLNAKGQLIGVAFDGNWEGMGGNIKYLQSIQRCINVDIKYILFIIDKYAGAGRIIEELKLFNN